MKKYVLLTIAIAFAHFVIAQPTSVEFGVKGGVNFAHFKIDPSYNTDSRVGYHLGMLTHIHVSEHFAVQPELMLSSQGADYGDGDKDKFTYVNIPVLAQVMFGEGFRFQTGPQFGILANAKSENNNNTEADIDDNYKTTDLAWSFGAGYLWPSGLGVDVRYNHGITNISKSAPDVMNRVWQMGLFYQFRKVAVK